MLYKIWDVMKKIKFEKIFLQQNIRRGLAALLCIMFLFSIITTIVSYQEPANAIENVVSYAYSQTGIFDFTVHLKNNSVYNRTVIKPEQETVFAQIVDGINASFIYKYSGNRTIIGQYSLSVTVMTELWEKNFVIVPRTSFSSKSFSFDFPLNITYYEEVVAEINDEIGIKASDPTLVIMCNIVVSSNISKGPDVSFSPSINLSLGGNIIEFDGDFLQSDLDVIMEENQVILQDVIDKQNIWSALSTVFLAIIVGFVFITESIPKKYDIEKLFRKIKKKYGEWIVEVEKPPTMALDSESVSMKSIEDLIKTSEELGKPVIHVSSSQRHIFYVFDGSIIYEYSIPKK